MYSMSRESSHDFDPRCIFQLEIRDPISIGQGTLKSSCFFFQQKNQSSFNDAEEIIGMEDLMTLMNVLSY